MPTRTRNTIKPPALQAGDRVAVVAPASNIDRDSLLAGCEALRRLGYEPSYDEAILSRDLYFAGPLERRAEELHRAFRDPQIKAIFCGRGGYGSNHLLPELDINLIRKHPKVFCGYSDITSLLTLIHDACGLVTFHAPMVAKDFAHADGADEASLHAALTGEKLSLSSDSGMRALVPGEAEGTLYGGCLSMLAASLGTPFEVHTDDTILFIEDIAAKPYQIDRMLMQLKLAGKFDRVHGIVFGEMIDCVQPGGQDYTLDEVILRILRDLDVPIAFGLRSGHVSRGNITLPIGVRARLALGGEAKLETLEPATAPAKQATKQAVLR